LIEGKDHEGFVSFAGIIRSRFKGFTNGCWNLSSGLCELPYENEGSGWERAGSGARAKKGELSGGGCCSAFFRAEPQGRGDFFEVELRRVEL